MYGVYGVVISPDDRYLASAGLGTIAGEVGGGEVRLWDIESRRVIEILKTNDSNCSVAFSPDSKVLAFATAHHGVTLWDIQGHREVTRFPAETVSWATGPFLRFSPNGRQLAIGWNDGKVVIWDLATGATALKLAAHASPVLALFFSPDGQRLITAGSYNDHRIRVWSLPTGERLATLTNNTARLQGVALSPDGKTLATGDWDWKIRILDLAQQRQLALLTNHTATVWALAFSPDGKMLASASGRCIKLWDTGNWQELTTLKGSSGVGGIVFSSDGKRLFSDMGEGKIVVWDARPRPAKTQVLKRPDDYVYTAYWSHSGFFLAPASGAPFCMHANHTFNFWDPQTLRRLPEHRLPESEPLGGRRWVALSPGGERLAIVQDSGALYLMDVERERRIAPLPGWPSNVTAAGLSPGGSLLAATAPGDGLKIWDINTRTSLGKLDRSDAPPYLGWCFTTNGEKVAIGSSDGTVGVWNLSRKERVAEWKAHNGAVVGVAFMPDGSRLVTVTFGEASVWDLASPHEVVTLRRVSSGGWSVAVSPDGQRIAIGTGDGQIKIWSPTTGQELIALRGVNDWMDRNTPDWPNLRWVVGLAFLPPDANTLISASVCEARIWRAPSWAEIEELEARERKEAEVQVAVRQRDEEAAMERLVARQRDEEAAMERLAARQRDEAERERADAGAIKEWLVLAPIAFEGGTQETALRALEQEHVPQEANLRPRAGDRAKVGESERVWRKVQLKDTLLDLNELLGKVTEWSVAYAVCYIGSEAAKTRLLMKVGSDGQAKVYLNGKEIYRCEEARACELDQDVVPRVELKAGLNVVVFKVVNGTGGWAGSVRFTDASGQPIKGIRVTLDPDARNDNSHQ
jgi:WD40 repeat protein